MSNQPLSRLKMTNAKRAENVNQCIVQYEQITQSERENSLTDFLASAMHWADEQGQDFAEKLRLAIDRYESEVAEERQERASMTNFTVIYTDLAGLVMPYTLQAFDQDQAEAKFLQEFGDNYSDIELIITHVTSPGYKQLHEDLSEMVEEGKMRDRGVANLLTELTRIP